MGSCGGVINSTHWAIDPNTNRTSPPLSSVQLLNLISYGYISPVIVVFGIFGDLMSILVLSHPLLKRSSIIYSYLLALAITDLFTLLSLFPMLLYFIDIRLCDYYSAYYYAHVGFPLTNAFMGTSVWIVTFLTFAQYVAVCHPFRALMRSRRIILYLVIFCYVLNICIYLPWAFKKSVFFNQASPCPYISCDNSNADVSTTQKAMLEQKAEKEEKRLWLLLVALILLYLICSIPAAPLTVLVSDERQKDFEFEFIRAVTNILEFTKFALNFYFYCMINPDIRTLALKRLTCQELYKPAMIGGGTRTVQLSDILNNRKTSNSSGAQVPFGSHPPKRSQSLPHYSSRIQGLRQTQVTHPYYSKNKNGPETKLIPPHKVVGSRLSDDRLIMEATEKTPFMRDAPFPSSTLSTITTDSQDESIEYLV